MSGTITINANDLLSAVKPQLLQMPEITQQTYSYVIWTDGTNYYAKNGSTGKIDYSGTNASTVIQNAINSLSAGGKIYIRKGIYTITNTITLSDGITLEGEIRASGKYYDTKGTILRGSADPILKVTVNKDQLYQNLIEIRNIRIEPTTSNTAILVSPQNMLDGLNIINVGIVPKTLQTGYGIVLDATQYPIINTLIHRVELWYLDKAIWGKGIHISDSTVTYYLTTLTISKSTFERCKTAIRLEGAWTTVINNNIVENSEYNGVEIYTSGNVWITNNHFENNPFRTGVTGYDLVIQGEPTLNRYANAIHIRENMFGSRNAVANIYLNYASRIIIIGNGFVYTPQNNIYAENNTYYLWIERNIFSTQNTIQGTLYKNIGKATFSGDGATTQFKIAHGLGSLPTLVVVTPASSDAKGNFYVTVDNTYIYVNYSTAPPAGTNNIQLYWYAQKALNF